jgi:hypothetical protein
LSIRHWNRPRAPTTRRHVRWSLNFAERTATSRLAHLTRCEMGPSLQELTCTRNDLYTRKGQP